MATRAKAIPEGQGGVTPYLCVQDAAAAIEFYKRALGATELFRIADPSGRVGHAELQIGSGRIMLSDEFPDHDAKGPRALGGSPVTLHLYVEDVDHVAAALVAGGAKTQSAVTDQFYGDRGGKFEDPFGHIWWIATHTEDVSPEEMKARAKKLYG